MQNSQFFKLKAPTTKPDARGAGQRYEPEEGAGGPRPRRGVGVGPSAALAAAWGCGGRGAGRFPRQAADVPGGDAGPPLWPPGRHGRLLLPPDPRPPESPQIPPIRRRLRRLHPSLPPLANLCRATRSSLVQSLYLHQ